MELSKLKLFFIVIFFGAAQIEAASFYLQLSSEQKNQWLKILHYNLDKNESEQDSSLFFINEKGKFSPKDEFDSTVNEMRNPSRGWGRFNLPASCAFHSRYLFIKSLNIAALKEHECDPFEKWKTEIDPIKLSLVFSTAYPNNPASSFGHTFIRLHRRGNPAGYVDYSLSFEARIENADWGPVYVYKGLSGGYPGLFDLTKYYQKIGEYIHGEGRDLYEYEIPVSQEKIDYFLSHVWELYNTTYFDYYFASENCSYHLSKALDVILDRPLKIPNRFFYLPVDLVESLKEHFGSLKEIFIPSVKKELIAATKDLSPDQMKELIENFSHYKASQDLPILDAQLTWLMYQKSRKKGVLSISEEKFLKEVLIKRSQHKGKFEKIIIKDRKNSPLLTTPPRKFSIGYIQEEYQKEHGTFEVSFENGYQYLMSSDLGLGKNGEFRFLGARLSGNKHNGWQFKEANLVNVTSLHPFTFFEKQLSWHGAFRLIDHDFIQKNKLTVEAKGALGIAHELFSNTIINYFMGVRINGGSAFEKGHGEAIYFDTGILTDFNDGDFGKLYIGAEFGYFYPYDFKDGKYYELKVNQSLFLSKYYELLLSLKKIGMLNIDSSEVKGSLSFSYRW